MKSEKLLTGIGNIQGLAAGTTMSIGGGVGDASTNITYSTKPNNLITNYGTGAITTTINRISEKTI